MKDLTSYQLVMTVEYIQQWGIIHIQSSHSTNMLFVLINLKAF